jgi:hypothetical protein
MKKYLVFIFCLMFAVSFVACGGKNAARQSENSNPSKPEELGHPGSDSSDSDTTSSGSDDFILQEGDKVSITSFTEVSGSSHGKYTLALKFERGGLLKEISIEVVVAEDDFPVNLRGVHSKVIDMDGDKKMYVAVYKDKDIHKGLGLGVCLSFFSLTEDESNIDINYTFKQQFCICAGISVSDKKIYTVKKNIEFDNIIHDYVLLP